MGVIRNAANQQIKGKVGAVTYYVSEGRQIARQALNNSNYGKSASRTEAQQNQRIKWANLVNFYKVCQKWMPKAFEGKKSGQSDYNRLMQVNMPYTDIYLTKTLATVGACIAEDYIISQGTLPSVEVVQVTDYWRSNLYVGGLSIDNETTVAEFTSALVENNVNIEAGMQISFVSLMQTIDNIGVPRLVCTFYEVTLKADSEELLRDYLPELCTIVHDGCLSTSSDLGTGAFAYVVSDLRRGALKVSTQQLITKNSDLITRFSSDKARVAAIESYGLDPDVILSPLTENEQGATPVPFFITTFVANGTIYQADSEVPEWVNLESPWLMSFSQNVEISAIDYVLMKLDDGRVFTIDFVQTGGNVLSLERPGGIIDGAYVAKFIVRMTSGVILEIPFTHASE